MKEYEGIKVAELQGTSGASAAIDRSEGFHKVADSKLNVVASQTANFNRTEGMSVMENMLQADGDIKAVFAANDEMALGAVEAMSGAGKNVENAVNLINGVSIPSSIPVEVTLITK